MLTGPSGGSGPARAPVDGRERRLPFAVPRLRHIAPSSVAHAFLSFAVIKEKFEFFQKPGRDGSALLTRSARNGIEVEVEVEARVISLSVTRTIIHGSCCQ